MAQSGFVRAYQLATRWRDDRVAMAEAQKEIDEGWDLLPKLRRKHESGEITRGELEASEHRVRSDMDLPYAEISKIETRRLIKRAIDWRVPIPKQPERYENDENWDWCKVHGRHYFNVGGASRLRREISTEIELRYRPVLPWAALVISVLSLAVSVLKP